uniref:Uncharacterized protein n=1 Tax=Manihot esculenta TaxID=3983 RepID=A0A2C9VYL5_MANES
MGLNEGYEHVKDQILLMDPFSNVNKAYSMALRVEKQREIQNVMVESSETTAVMLAKSQNFKRDNGTSNLKFGFKKKDFKKEERFCTYYSTGHVRESCFKLVGYSDGYNKFKQKKGRHPS